MPEDASTFAPSVDWLNNFITYVAAFSTVALTAVMLYFAIRYRRRSDNDKTANISHNTTLEVLWTVVPTVIVMWVFYYGFVVYREMRTPPPNSLEVVVEGFKWGWNFVYPNGKRGSRELVVPIDTPIKLIMRSRDVNHSFFIPAMRIKEDVIAGTYHYQWFQPTKLGKFHIFCTEYCGLNHSQMLGELRVVTREEYQDYINDRQAEELTPAMLGAKLYTEQNCVACHTLDGTAKVGPTFKGVFGTPVSFEDGTTGTIDEAYLIESIVNPAKRIHKGYPNAMPPVYDKLTPEQLDGLVAYIKSLK
jgi:cytochrome c oxidase subunit 2